MGTTLAVFFAAGLCGITASVAAGDSGACMETVLSLSRESSGASVDAAPRLHLFVLPRAEIPAPAVLVCPGGGYAGLAMDYEGTEVAQWLNRFGISAFVLEYRVAPHRHPAPLEDAQAALALIRSNAEAWGIDAERLGVLGFSAGGHLAATLSTHSEPGSVFRPDFTILIYPVISFLPPFGHSGCGVNLLGADADPLLARSLCNHERVTSDTPPAFLVHTTGDSVVSAENSIAYYQALLRAGVQGELHIYEQGEHGYGMGKGDPILSTWTEHCIAWLRQRNIIASPS